MRPQKHFFEAHNENLSKRKFLVIIQYALLYSMRKLAILINYVQIQQLTYISHVVLHSVFRHVVGTVKFVELSRRVNILPLKVLLIDPQLVRHFGAQIDWMR